MGTAQHHGIHPVPQKGFAVFRNGGGQSRVIGGHAAFHHRRQPGAGNGGNGLSGALFYFPGKPPAFYRCFGGGQPDFSGFAASGSRFGSGSHHIIAGDRQRGQRFSGITADGTAGRNERFYILPQQSVGQLAGHSVYFLGGTVPVGHPGGIAQINQGFPRQQLPQGPHGGKPADAGIKNADGSGIHLQRLLRMSFG